MVIFILPIFLRIIDPKINRDNRWSIGPDRRDQVDTLNDPVVLPTPVPGYHVDLMRIGLVQGAVINYQYTLSCLIIRFASLYSASVWWGCLSNNRLTESWAMGSVSFGKHRDASEHVHAWYVAMRKLTKSLFVHFGGFTLVRSPFRVCLTLNGLS